MLSSRFFISSLAIEWDIFTLQHPSVGYIYLHTLIVARISNIAFLISNSNDELNVPLCSNIVDPTQVHIQSTCAAIDMMKFSLDLKLDLQHTWLSIVIRICLFCSRPTKWQTQSTSSFGQSGKVLLFVCVRTYPYSTESYTYNVMRIIQVFSIYTFQRSLLLNIELK